MTRVYVGRGTFRVTVRAKRMRERLASIDGVRIEGERVYYPGWLDGSVRRIIEGPRRPWRRIAPVAAAQTALKL